jgi:hypothetical protein
MPTLTPGKLETACRKVADVLSPEKVDQLKQMQAYMAEADPEDVLGLHGDKLMTLQIFAKDKSMDALRSVVQAMKADRNTSFNDLLEVFRSKPK